MPASPTLAMLPALAPLAAARPRSILKRRVDVEGAEENAFLDAAAPQGGAFAKPPSTLNSAHLPLEQRSNFPMKSRAIAWNEPLRGMAGSPGIKPGSAASPRMSGAAYTEGRGLFFGAMPPHKTAESYASPLIPGLRLQRKCACGSPSASGEVCAECAKRKRQLQRKLTVGANNDPLEREADQVADQVLSLSAPGTSSHAPVRVQRFAGNSEGREASAPASVERVLAGSGQALQPDLRKDMEGRFGHDFSRLRVHTGDGAAQSAREVNAHAYTVGREIVFGAGRFAPETHEGRRLLAHEMTHVVQQQTASGATPALQRQALSYDTTAITIPPLPDGFTLIASQNLVEKAKKATTPKLTSASVKGVKAASNEEIYLYYIIAQVAEADNWGTEHDLIAPIGWPAKAGGAVPVGKVTVIIDSAGAATAELLSAGAVPAPTTHKTAASAIAALKTTYGISKVTDDTATWSPDDLNKVVGAFAFVPAGDRAALKGVELIRVDALGGNTAGEFNSEQSVADTTVVNTATLKLANKAFEGDPVSFVGDAGKASPASYQTIVHEVAHAIEKKAKRDAAHAHHQAIAKSNEAIGKEKAAFGVLDPLQQERSKIVQEYNAAPTAAEQRKIKPRLDAAKQKEAPALAKFEAAETARKAAKQTAEDKGKLADATLLSAAATTALQADSQAKKTTFDSAVAAAQTAAKGFDPTDSTAAGSFITTVDGATKAISDYVTASAVDGADLDTEAEKVLKAFGTRDTARTVLLKAAPKNPVPGAFDATVNAQEAWFTAERTQAHAKKRTARLQKFVEFVTANKIRPFTDYARKNWPFKPGEFYAEAYSLWRTDPTYLKANAKDLFDWFEKSSYL